MKRILVCHAQIPFYYGGVEILVEELVRNIGKSGYLVDKICLPFKWYPTEEIINNVLAWRLLDISQSNGDNIDLVICTKFPTYVVNHPNKVLWLVHQYRDAYDLYGTQYSDFIHLSPKDRDNIIGQIKNIDNKTIKECKKRYTISQNVANRLLNFNGIDSEVLYPALRDEMEFKADEYGDYIFVAGRLDPLKRYDILIRSLRYTKSKAKFKIAGKGKYGKELERLVKDLKLEDKVEFLGFVENDHLVELYGNALAVYFSPYDEDYGYITIEAFRSKRPVLTTSDSGGVLEFVENEKTGYIIPFSGDEKMYKAMAKRIDYLFQNRDEAQRLGQAGYRKVEKITWEKIIDKLVREPLGELK